MFEIRSNRAVPTGNICTMNGEHGVLEFLSVGDYGKERNLKADFMGLTREVNGVQHGKMLSLEEKWVITISTQYSCAMKCQFCDVPNVPQLPRNATVKDMMSEMMLALSLHPEVKNPKRINLHFARMGEPSFNYDVIRMAVMAQRMFRQKRWGFHPVVSTMCPVKNKHWGRFVGHWMAFKDVVANGDAGLQLSINTTDSAKRNELFHGNAMELEDISSVMYDALLHGIKGRKITLNFALTDAPIDAKYLRRLFNPEYFLCKITPMHVTESSNEHNLITHDGYESYYPYKATEEALKNEGFDVIVFIPSKEEDESKITCGNAILAEKDQLFN